MFRLFDKVFALIWAAFFIIACGDISGKTEEKFMLSKNIHRMLATYGRYKHSIPSSAGPIFICRNIYKLYVAGSITEPTEDPPNVTAYSLTCTSEFKNLFCTNTQVADWKRGKCNIIGKRFECPLYETYETYTQFFTWKITTFVVKIEYSVNGKRNVTIEKPVTPYFKCPNIRSIGSHDKMFPKIDHKHDPDDCWE